MESASRPRSWLWAGLGCLTAPLLIVILLIVVVRTAFDRYKQTGHSMEPTIAKGDALLVRPAVHLERGDLIAFAAPGYPREIFIMRAVAFGGEVVELRENGAVVNGVELAEPYLAPNDDSLPEAARFRNMPSVSVDTDSVFVLGDNRDHANDSRFIGAVKRQSIRGRVVLVISP